MVKKRKRSFLLTVCLICAIIWFLVSIISTSKGIEEKKLEVKQLQAQYDAKIDANEELQRMIDSGAKDEYIEKIAREKYGYIKPGDRVYQDVAAGE